MPNLPSWPAGFSPGHQAESTTKAVALPVVTAGRGEARNWLRRVLRLAIPSASRKEVLTTDEQLQSGPAPQMIERTFSDLSGGTDGPHTRAFPAFGSFAYIPHQQITHAAGKAIPLRTFDDGAHVPAIYAGNPNG